MEDNKIQLFHSALILPEQVILLTDDYDNAVILKSPEQIQMMEDEEGLRASGYMKVIQSIGTTRKSVDF